jgi:hypothetical protein
MGGRAAARQVPPGTQDPPLSCTTPVVGDLELSYEVMEFAADTGLRPAIFTAEPGSCSEEALDLLVSWAATPEHRPAAPARDDVPRP